MVPLHCTNMTSVFFTLMTKSLALQKRPNTETRNCNYSTDGAINTISSAKANIKMLIQEIVKSLHCYLVRDSPLFCSSS